ncbi:MAG: formylglycine-generating enzyme family protein [Magnetococcus sp. DMHC-1]
MVVGKEWICPITGMKFVWIPSGEFLMGSPGGEEERSGNEGPQHQVKLDGFWMGKFSVTQGEYEQVMGKNPSKFKGVRNPVENVSWDDAQEFIEKLNVDERGDGGYQMPTEAQWEYACRAGSKGRWCFGDDEKLLKEYAWYAGNSGGKTHPVGEKKPNEIGLHDMHGNVWEWVSDWYDENFYANSPKDNPQGPSSGSARVNRGGSWGIGPAGVRSAVRAGDDPDICNAFLGFRLSRTCP